MKIYIVQDYANVIMGVYSTPRCSHFSLVLLLLPAAPVPSA